MRISKKSSTFARKFQLMNKMKKSILIVLMAAMSVAGMAQHHPEYHGDRGHGHGGHHYIECATHEQMTDLGRSYYREKCEEWNLTKEVIEHFITEGGENGNS